MSPPGSTTGPPVPTRLAEQHRARVKDLIVSSFLIQSLGLGVQDAGEISVDWRPTGMPNQSRFGFQVALHNVLTL